MIKETLYNAAYSVLKKTILLEMSIAKKEYGDRVYNMFHRVIEHYLFIKADPESTAVNHWKNEIVALLGPVVRSKYSHTKKYPKASEFTQHVKDSGHEYTSTGFEDVYRMFRTEKKLPPLSHSDFVKISKEFDAFLKHIAPKVEHGQLITIKDVL